MVKPRLIRTDAERMFGSDTLPIVSHHDPVAGRFIDNSHTIDLWDAYTIHCSKRSTLMKLRRGPWGIVLEKAEGMVKEHIQECPRCNIDKMFNASS